MKPLIVAVILLSCSGVSPAAQWKLVWADEFTANGLPDSTKWTYEEGYVRNQERQYYTRERAENARAENGLLILEARKEQFPNARYQAGSENWQRAQFAGYTSASLTTEGKVSWRYGRIEVRAKLPTGRGTWPAIWMLGVNRREVGWPACGEIDIMEYVGYDPEVIHANIHTQAYNHVKKTGKGAPLKVPRPWESFHTYAIEWTPERMDFFVDDQKYFSFANEKTGAAAWPYDQPFYLILNIAIGGSWGGSKGIDDTIFPQRMEVDYVRVYEAAQ
jgi:beta-glucanase (GH16 family)